MKKNISVYYANFLQYSAEEYNTISEYKISESSLDFVSRCIALSKRKKAEINISVINNQLKVSIQLLHGIFPKIFCDELARLMLDASDVQLYPVGDKNKYNLNIIFHLEVKKH